MTGLDFTVTGASAMPMALVPTIAFDLHVTADQPVQSMLLRCQVRVAPDQRRYDPDEQQALLGLFGEPHRYVDTLQAFPLTHVTLPVGGFEASTAVTLPVEMTYDTEVATGQYLHALRDGVVPLLFLFSGSVFLRAGDGIQVEQIPWDREAHHGLPVQVWRDAMDRHFPDSGWLRLRRETIDHLLAYRGRNALLGWDDTIAHLLAQQEAQA